MCTWRGHFSSRCRFAAAETDWQRTGLSLSSKRPVYFRPVTPSCSSAGLISLHLVKSRAPKSFLALHMPLSISSTKRVFLHPKEDGAHYGIPLLLSALKYRSGGYVRRRGAVDGPLSIRATPPNADCRLLVLATPWVQPIRQLTLYFPISWLPPRPSLFPFSSLSPH